MKKKLMMMVAAVAAAIGAWTGLAETVTNVRGMQREKSNLVDIYYDIEATDGGMYSVKVEIEGRTNEVTAATFTGDVGEGIAPGKNRHILWNAGADWPDKKGDVRAIVTAEREPEKGKPKKVQLWEGGPYWADRNIGADNPWESGLYFWWGDTTGYHPSGLTFEFKFDYCNTAIYTYGKSKSKLEKEGWLKINYNLPTGVLPGVGELAPEHDAAHMQWGGGWRMPTSSELYDLFYTYCDWMWATQNGVNGYVVRGRGDYSSNSIFLPAAGYGVGVSLRCSGSQGRYWSSNPYGDGLYYNARSLYFYSGSHSSLSCRRDHGLPIRPVQGFTK